jgi:antirestriction protein ArdC
VADKKPSNREQIKQIVAGIEDSIQQIFQSEQYMDYLRTMSRFHSYSVNNTILIHMQMPNATQVAGFNKWKNQFGRHVKKGEKGLTVIAPTPFKKKIEEMKLDPDTKAPVLDGEGKVVMEEREIEIPMFKPVKVFDVSQTEGRPLPSLVTDLTGNVQHYEAFMEALRRTSPMPIYMEPLRPGLDGLCNFTKQTISVREGMSQVQTVCATVHETAHAVLHDKEHIRLTAAAGDETKEPPKPKDKNTMEVEAESVSYTVCQYYGIETGANSLGYIATWSKDRSLPELKASLETISKTASALITSIDRHFAEICKERGIDLTAQQPKQAAVEAPVQETLPAPELPDTPERFMDDMMDLMDRLYAAGRINRNFPPDNREQIKVEQVRTLRVNPSLARAVLEKFIREDTGAAEAGALLERLDALIENEKRAALEKEFVYRMEANPSSVGVIDTHFIQAYEKTEQGTLKPGDVLFISSADKCQRLLNDLEKGALRQTDFFQIRSARVSRYTTKDGAELDALVDTGDKIYLGRRDHYDNRGHYVNGDNSLIYLSDNDKMFNFVSGEGYVIGQADMVAQGYLSQEDYAEYDSLRMGVLAQFQEVKPFLFAGEPFRSSQPEAPEIPTTDQQEALYLLDDSVYLHIQASDGGWDYTLYTKHDMAQLDGGQLEARSMADAVEHIRKTEEIGTLAVELAPMEVLDKLRDAADQAVQAAVDEIQSQRRDRMDELRGHFSQEDAALWDTTLDEYPLPDASLTLDDLMDGGDLLSVSREQAAAFLEQDMTVYMVEAMKDPAMVFDQEDLMELPKGMRFAIPREEWEESPDFRRAVLDRMQHQEEREQAFLDHGADCFAIYQVRNDDALRDIRFESLDWLKSIRRTVERNNYDLVYTAPLPVSDSADAALNQLWYQFNNEHPADFQHPSMSVSDIVALKRDGVVTCHYCDSFGFEQLPDFLTPKPTVAELEDQVKNGQQISLMDLAGAVHREKGQKKSVVSQLKKQPQPGRKKTAPKKSAEKEI